MSLAGNLGWLLWITGTGSSRSIGTKFSTQFLAEPAVSGNSGLARVAPAVRYRVDSVLWKRYRATPPPTYSVDGVDTVRETG
eukprot:SAG31_NODE_843_length_11551_cov_6.757772_15_plen_82_part_00